MSEGSKFPFKKIVEFIIREETAFKAVAAFLKAMQDHERRNLEALNEFSKDIQEAALKLSNKQTAKMLSNFSIHQTERTQGEANLALITEKLNSWTQGALQKLKGVQQKARRLQSRKQSLTNEQINEFKKQLTEQVLQLNRLKQSMIKLYCHTMIRNSCLQLEELTSKMQIELERRNLPPSGMNRK